MRHSPFQYEQDPHEGFGALIALFVAGLVAFALVAAKGGLW